jgi:hypothetical protein
MHDVENKTELMDARVVFCKFSYKRRGALSEKYFNDLMQKYCVLKRIFIHYFDVG